MKMANKRSHIYIVILMAAGGGSPKILEQELYTCRIDASRHTTKVESFQKPTIIIQNHTQFYTQ